MSAAPHILCLPLSHPGPDQKSHVLVAVTLTSESAGTQPRQSQSQALDLELVATDSLKAYVLPCKLPSPAASPVHLPSGIHPLFTFSISAVRLRPRPALFMATRLCATIPSHPSIVTLACSANPPHPHPPFKILHSTEYGLISGTCPSVVLQYTTATSQNSETPQMTPALKQTGRIV